MVCSGEAITVLFPGQIVEITFYWTNDNPSVNTFSMADIKTQYVNEFLLDILIITYGKDLIVEKNNSNIRKLYQLGRIAA